MERKLTILMRALLAVALVAITLVLTYEFWRAGNGKSSLDVQEIRLQASISRRSVPGGLYGRRKYPSTMPATPSWCCRDILTNPSPKTERSTSIFAISGWSSSKRHKDRFPWDAPGSSAGHQNGGQRLAQPHFPRYFDHGRKHHPFLPLQKRYAGTLRLFAERNPCGGRAPALSEIRPHRRRAGHAGGRHRPAGRRAWRHQGDPPPDESAPETRSAAPCLFTLSQDDALFGDHHPMEKQLLQSRISIMLSQIQPHFPYNSLTAIRQLCDIDPPKAKQAVTLFSRYLRGNTELLTTARCIPRDHQDLQYNIAVDMTKLDCDFYRFLA